ncbi:sigma-70 family RNA polymerase sigma factor [Streptomyces sp. RKND-216]|uniref:RNA polymerase sigma factor n=1 Tax=Streptomyces sp. RKND-216 TaxID=2562581 RepID=UPI00109E2BAE|nr:sigma-70 family RNA polymerase sigma factor [Streptomyces sp. RKND-216]THA27288.1 sigma-70 family RNA polymerase sigma factor [Streptomyces sp. RKND-216]
MTTRELPAHLDVLLAAECTAESHGTGADPDDVRQAVRLRWLEHVREGAPPSAPAAWLRAAVRAEMRHTRRRSRREVPLHEQPYGPPSPPAPTFVLAADGYHDPATAAEAPLLAAERRHVLRTAVTRLPGRCPQVLAALLDGGDRTYREIAAASGISQGSIGPLRSRCLACLRRMLSTEVAAPAVRGRVR